MHEKWNRSLGGAKQEAWITQPLSCFSLQATRLMVIEQHHDEPSAFLLGSQGVRGGQATMVAQEMLLPSPSKKQQVQLSV